MEIRGWSEYRLAKAANLPQSTISHLFKRNNAPTFSTIDAICSAFHLTMAQFFADAGEPIVLTSEQRELLIQWGSLSDEQRTIIQQTIQQFCKVTEE